MIKWHIVTSEVFRNGTATPGHMYFLSDTKEIYRGSDPFTESVIVYTGALPANPALNRLYINSENLEGKIWAGQETGWTTVIKAVSDEVLDQAGLAVSGKAVVAYVAAEIAKLSTAANTVSSLSWDSAEHILTVNKGDASTENIVFDGLGVSLNYNSVTGVLQLLDASGAKVGTDIKLDLERFVTAGVYDPDKKSIFLYFDKEKTDFVEIPVADLVDTYTAQSTGSVNMSVSGNVFTADVKISTNSGNLITLDEKGLYVAPIDISGKMDKVSSSVIGNIATFGENGQVVDSGKNLNDIKSNANIYVGASIEEAVAGNVPAKNDICIVKAEIGKGTGKYQHTAYVYDGSAWAAMDGNYNAENVFFADNLVTTHAIGNITLNNGQATIPAAGKNLKDVWNSIFVKSKNPTTSQPSVSIVFNQAGSYEAGQSVTPSYTARLDPGSYSYGPETGVTAESWNVTNTDGGAASTNSGSFDAIVVKDDTNYTITATATHGEGAIPVTNIGAQYPAGKIAAGTKTKTSAAITGFRNAFYGTLTDKTELTSDVIRGLKGKLKAPRKGSTMNMDIPVGARRIVVAFPATVGDASSIIDVNGMNTNIISAFTVSQIDVEGYNNYAAIAYKVYCMDLANANDVKNTYKITL